MHRDFGLSQGLFDLGGDVVDHGAGSFAAEDVFVAVFHADEKAVGRFAVISHISADVAFSENAPVAHITA